MRQALPKDAVVAVIGAGAMGAGIAQIAAHAGHPVLLFDLQPGAATQAIGRIRAAYAKLVQKGKLGDEAATAAGERLSVASALTDLSAAVLVVEAIVERLEVKRGLFEELEGIVAADAILATNTSSISVTAIAAKLKLPARVVGMHFFNPAPLMKLVEVVSGLDTDPAVAGTVHDTALAWGKKPVYTRSTPGFIVNRVARPYYAESLRLLNERAAEPATIDAVMREAGGFRMGPFELMDLIGHDVNFAVTRSVFDAYFGDPRFTPSLIQQELVDAGRLGRKSSRGFYDYAPGGAVSMPATEPPAQPSDSMVICSASPLGAALSRRLAEAGAACEVHEGVPVDGRVARVGQTLVFVTDGRSATQRSADIGHHATVVADLTLDPGRALRIALAAAETCSEKDFRSAVAMFQSAGFSVSRLDDVPGLVVMRTVAMLANEAADAVNQGVCDAQAADTAMQYGVNYPRGPLAWADEVGLDQVLAVLDNLARVYGEDRYRASPLLRRKLASGNCFHG